MDAWTWINVVIAGASATFALLGVLQTRRNRIETKVNAEAAKTSADRAVNAAEQSAQAADRGASALEEQAEISKQQLPPTWSQAVKVGNNRYEITNNSTKTLIVERLEPDNPALDDFVIFDGPVRVTHGDKFSFNALATFGALVNSVEIVWHVEDETEERRDVRNIR